MIETFVSAYPHQYVYCGLVHEYSLGLFILGHANLFICVGLYLMKCVARFFFKNILDDKTFML